MIAVKELAVGAGSFSLEGITFEVPSSSYAVLMGRTGSGKTTILETICGLRRPLSGSITLDHCDVTRRKPAERGIGYVPQDGALFASMTVRDHLAFSLSVRRWPSHQISHRVEELAAIFHLEPLLLRRPQGLSGGEQQRVALGRALACRPGILCLDEPLSALDDESHEEMYGVLEGVRRHSDVTILHVTHSRRDAKRLADRILLLRDGRIQEISAHAFDGTGPPACEHSADKTGGVGPDSPIRKDPTTRK